MAPSPDSPPKRPRLSLQIRAISNGPSVRTSRTLAAVVNPTSPTSFNTLSNVYVTAIGKSSCASPIVPEPLTAIRTSSSSSLSSSSAAARLPALKLQTGPQIQIGVAPPPSGMFPDTPLTAQPRSPAVYREIKFPSAMTATPPLSAGPVETAIDNRAFSFSCEDTVASRLAAAAAIPTTTGNPRTPAAMSPRTPRRRATAPGRAGGAPPYTHPRSLHSILRNSPLPPKPARSPVSPRRQSQRLREKALRRVEYDSPLEQTITTNKYTKSHIDLLCEEAANSPYSASPTTNPPLQATTTPATTPTTTTGNFTTTAAAAAAAATAASTTIITPTQPETIVLDLAMAYTGDETRDGGQTPGPFEEMRRRMAGLAASSPLSSPSSSGVRKQRGAGGAASKRKEKKRRWVWTIGVEDEAGDGDEVGGAIAAAKAAEAAAAGTPMTAVATPTMTTTTTTTAAASAAAITPNSAAAAPVVLAPNPRPRARSVAGAAKLAIVTAAVSAAISAAAATPSSSSITTRGAAAAAARAVSEEPLTAIQRRRPLSIDTARCLAHGGPPRPPPEEITPSIESSDLSQGGWSASSDAAGEEGEDVEMSDASSVVSDLDFLPPRPGLDLGDGDMDVDLVTPTLPRKHRSISRLGSEDLFAQGQAGTRRDTPIPSDLICS
ncbi:hypothetical protein RB597_006033 [Gaeumannomyces tritici]